MKKNENIRRNFKGVRRKSLMYSTHVEGVSVGDGHPNKPFIKCVGASHRYSKIIFPKRVLNKV